MKNNDSKLLILERAPVPQAILHLAIPTILSMMVQILYNLTDTFFIGKLNDPYQVAAVTIALPVFMIQMAIAGIFGNGGASYLSRLLGNKSYYEARETTSTAIFCVSALSVVVGIAAYLMIDRILIGVGASANTYPHAHKYMQIILLGSPVVMLNFALSQLIRAEGAARKAMMGMLIGTGVNIVLDPLFIFVFRMGVSGAAVATLIGNACGVAYYAVYYTSSKCLVPPSLKTLHLRREIFHQIGKIGIPASLSHIMMSIGSSLSYNLASSYSDHHVAALGVAMRVFSIPIFIFIGLAVGIQPLLGYSYGARNYARLKETIRVSLIMAMSLALLFLLLFALFPRALIETFIVQPDVVSIGTTVLGAYVFAIPFAATGMIFMIVLQAMGKALPALIVALSRQGIVYIPAIFLLNRIWQFEGLIFALPSADAVTVLISACFVFVILGKYVHHIQDELPTRPKA